MEIYNWIIANKMLVGGLGIAVILAWDKAVALIKPLLSKTTSIVSPVKTDDIKMEVLDQEAIRHLRKRAAMLKNTKLISVLKEADSIFFDIHTGASNES